MTDLSSVIARAVRCMLPLLAALLVVSGCTGRSTPSSVPPDTPPASTVTDAAGQASPRILVFALDAVPFETVAGMVDEGAFPGFAPPDRLVSSFPSATTVAMSQILAPFGLEASGGYEARYYDRSRNKIVGGGLFSYNRVKFHWRTAWDWKAGNVRKLVSGLRPVHASLAAVDDALEAFAASDDPVFLAYTDATDLAGHLKSPDALERILDYLDSKIAALRAARPEQPFHVVLFSDHGQAGGQPLDNLRRPVRRALRDAGFRLRKRLSDRSDQDHEDVVLVPFGLLSSIIAHTHPSSAEAASRAVASVTGVEFCVASDGTPNRWRVLGRAGAATLERRTAGARIEWRYRVEGDDPLGLPKMENASAWRDDAWWRERTAEQTFPDALHRIAGGFDAVDNPASMICSLDPESMFGALLTSVSSRLSVGHLEWTHGTLHRAASMGFLLTDLPDWHGGGQLRAGEALVGVADHAREAHGVEPVIAPRSDVNP